MKWFRFYHDVIDDPKVQRLAPAHFKCWVNLLCLASRSDARGTIRMSVEEIAFACRMADSDAQEAIEALVASNLLEAVDGGYGIHNWETRQRKSDDVTARVTEHRERVKRDTAKDATLPVTGSETLHETLHVTSPETLPETKNPSAREEIETERETETEGNTPPSGAPHGADAPPPEKKPRRKSPAIPIPDDFTLTPERIAFASGEGLSDTAVRHEWRKFCSHAKSTDRRMVDWDATWRTWVLKAVEPRQQGHSGPARASPTVIGVEALEQRIREAEAREAMQT